jgi:hypothetical protein
VRRTDVNLGYADHDGHVESQGDSQMLFAHADQAIVGSNHEQAVVGLTAEHTEDGSAQVAFVTSQIGEADDFGLKTC